TDVNIAELVQRIGVTVPFRLDGKLTFRVQATIPLGNVKDFKAYRLHGTVTLAWAVVEDLRLEQVQATVTYDQGVLRLEKLTASVPAGAGAVPGKVSGTAQLAVVPAGDLTAKLTVVALPVGQLLRAIPNV